MENDTAFWQILLYFLAAYLIVRLLRGNDIRDYSLGNAGGKSAGATLGS